MKKTSGIYGKKEKQTKTALAYSFDFPDIFFGVTALLIMCFFQMTLLTLLMAQHF